MICTLLGDENVQFFYNVQTVFQSSKEKEAKCNVLQTEADKLKQLMSHLERQIDKKLYQQAVLSKAERENITLVSELRTKARLLVNIILIIFYLELKYM